MNLPTFCPVCKQILIRRDCIISCDVLGATKMEQRYGHYLYVTSNWPIGPKFVLTKNDKCIRGYFNYFEVIIRKEIENHSSLSHFKLNLPFDPNDTFEQVEARANLLTVFS